MIDSNDLIDLAGLSDSTGLVVSNDLNNLVELRDLLIDLIGSTIIDIFIIIGISILVFSFAHVRICIFRIL